MIAISTDYRDLRKAAYQEYVVSFDYNVVRLPPALSYEEGSTLGVAFVAASLALGICMGVNFNEVTDGPDLLQLVKSADPDSIPEDVRAETLRGIPEHERAKPGDWIAVWGGQCKLYLVMIYEMLTKCLRRLSNIGQSYCPACETRRTQGGNYRGQRQAWSAYIKP